MQQHIYLVNKLSRLFITQPQIILVHDLQKKNKEKSCNHQIYLHE